MTQELIDSRPRGIRTSFLCGAIPRTVLLTAMSMLSANGAPAGPIQISPDGSAVVRLAPYVPIPSSSVNSSLIASTFPGWSTVPRGPGPGFTQVIDYQAGLNVPRDGGGGLMFAGYSAPTNTSGWIQIVTTNDLQRQGQRSPFVDGLPGATSPFLPGPFATSNSIRDFSFRYFSDLASIGDISWSANLYPADRSGLKSAAVYDGIQWGWQMKPALKGNSTGTFLSPDPSCPPATCFGSGTRSFFWGAPLQGSTASGLTFVPTPFNPRPGTVFSLGTLIFHNGTISLPSEVKEIDFDLGIDFDNLPEKSTTLHTTLALVNTPNTGDLRADADYVYFQSGGFSASFNVFEGRTATASLLAKIDKLGSVSPNIAAQDIGDDLGDDFGLTSSDVSYRISLLGWGDISDGGFQERIPGDVTTIVSEPTSSQTLILGNLVLLLFFRRKRQRQAMLSSHQNEVMQNSCKRLTDSALL